MMPLFRINPRRSWLALWALSYLLSAQSTPTRIYSLGSLTPLGEVLPLLQYAGEAHPLRMMLTPPILYLQSDGRVACLLCKESPEVTIRRDDEKQTSEQVVTLILKKKLKWGDGEDLTRDDVKFTLLTMAKAPYAEGRRPILPIARIEMDPGQPNKISLVLRHRRSDFNQLFSIGLLPKHKAELVDKLLQLPPSDPQYGKLIQDPGLYYGSFQVAAASTTQLLLTPNKKNEWEQSPQQDVLVRLFAGIPALTLALQKDEIDQTLARELSWTDYQDLIVSVPGLKDRYNPQFDSGHALEVMLLNMRSPTLVNPAIRSAIFHAVNRQAINEKAFAGAAMTTEGLLHPDLQLRTGPKLPAAYQLEAASHLLDQAGWKRGPDGWRYSEKDVRLSLNLSCSVSRLKLGWQKQVAEDLQKVGIELKIDSVPDADYLRQTLGHLRFKDAACMRWKLPPLSAPIQIFHSLSIPDAENSYVGSNFSGWEQTSINRILENMMREPEVPHLLRLFGRLERQFTSDLPAIPIAYLPRVTLSRKSAPDPGTKDLQNTLATFPAEGERGRAKF